MVQKRRHAKGGTKRYRKPRLKDYGDLRELTRGGGGTKQDGGGRKSKAGGG